MIKREEAVNWSYRKAQTMGPEQRGGRDVSRWGDLGVSLRKCHLIQIVKDKEESYGQASGVTEAEGQGGQRPRTGKNILGNKREYLAWPWRSWG